MKKKLFRLYINKDIALNEATSCVRDKVEHLEGFDRRCINMIKEDELREKEIKKSDEQINLYQHSYDVLLTILLHSKPYLLEGRKRQNESANWFTEYDIPLDLYKKGIQTAIGLIKGYGEEDHKEELKVLEELLLFRNE